MLITSKSQSYVKEKILPKKQRLSKVFALERDMYTVYNIRKKNTTSEKFEKSSSKLKKSVQIT